MFISQCPKCKNRFEAENDWDGQQAECPYCLSLITIRKQPISREQAESKPGSNSLIWVLTFVGIGVVTVTILLSLLYLYIEGTNSMIYSGNYEKHDHDKKLAKEFINGLPDEQQRILHGGGGTSEDRMNFYATFMNVDSRTQSAIIKSMEE